jgi:hypothetical protein
MGNYKSDRRLRETSPIGIRAVVLFTIIQGGENRLQDKRETATQAYKTEISEQRLEST